MWFALLGQEHTFGFTWTLPTQEVLFFVPNFGT